MTNSPSIFHKYTFTNKCLLLRLLLFNNSDVLVDAGIYLVFNFHCRFITIVWNRKIKIIMEITIHKILQYFVCCYFSNPFISMVVQSSVKPTFVVTDFVWSSNFYGYWILMIIKFLWLLIFASIVLLLWLNCYLYRFFIASEYFGLVTWFL